MLGPRFKTSSTCTITYVWCFTIAERLYWTRGPSPPGYCMCWRSGGVAWRGVEFDNSAHRTPMDQLVGDYGARSCRCFEIAMHLLDPFFWSSTTASVGRVAMCFSDHVGKPAYLLGDATARNMTSIVSFSSFLWIFTCDELLSLRTKNSSDPLTIQSFCWIQVA